MQALIPRFAREQGQDMRTYRDAKLMAKALRAELGRRGTALSHSECLDIVARQFGLDDWNVLAARLEDRPAEAAALIQPTGWVFTGSKPQLYEAGIDRGLPYGSGHPALIRCRYTEDDPAYAAMEKGFGAFMQSVAAEAFRGRRVVLCAELSTESVVELAALWLRIDSAANRTLLFDNMEGYPEVGPLTGTCDWTRRQIVVDVPQEAESLHFGFYLRGSGKAWAAGFDLREADPSEASTRLNRFNPSPVNLDFSRSARSAA